MYRSSNPVTHRDFFDRERELAELARRVESLRQGAPSWVAIIGRRKVGKTSLLLELTRRFAALDLVFVVLDSFEVPVPSMDLIRRLALRVVTQVFAEEVGASPEALAVRPAEYREALLRSPRLLRLPAELRALVLELPQCPLDADHLRLCLDLPERLAVSLGLRVLVAWDEFQVLAELRGKQHAPDLLPLMRSVWQRHTRVGYIISGSERTMLTQLVTSRRSPFFQHFALMELSGLPKEDAVALLLAGAPAERPIPKAIAARAVALLGGNPFYLQLFGEELVRLDPPYEEADLKQALQNLLFSRTGRLSLFFEGEYRALVGDSTTLAGTLQALAGGRRRLSEISREIGAKSGGTVRYLERLGDMVHKDDEGHYALGDEVFGLWLRWRAPGGTTVPMTVLGDEAERQVAEALARLGFDLVYQSRASRGAFDLLGTRGAQQLGVQVKRAKLPLRLSSASWARMEAEAARFGWRWLVAVVQPDGQVAMLDPGRSRGTRAHTLDKEAIIGNLPGWLQAN
jgi:AAA+ ATPase superfamily predicted ATPase/Holliday junction resolvase